MSSYLHKIKMRNSMEGEGCGRPGEMKFLEAEKEGCQI
jgi:hypothetical protein